MGCIIMKEKVPICMKGCLIINKKNRRLVTIAVLIVSLLAFVGMSVVILISPLYNESDGLQLTYNNPLLAAFIIEDFDDTNTATSSFWIQGGDPFNMKAGTHTSTICYRIECNPINQ